MSRQARRVANDKGDNEMTLGAVHRSPDICLTAEENPAVISFHLYSKYSKVVTSRKRVTVLRGIKKSSLFDQQVNHLYFIAVVFKYL